MKIKKILSNGFTMVEILIVVGIIVMLFGGVMISSYVFRNQIDFNSAVNSLKSITDEAKNSALSTLSYPDSDEDKDGDGRTCPDPTDTVNCDKILPNGYILNFDSTGDFVKVSLYADLMTSAINSLDPENDLFIRSIEFPESVKIASHGGSLSGAVYSLPNNFSVLYTATSAEFYILGEEIAKDSFQVRLRQTDSKGNVMRDKYMYIQNLNNTAQITDKMMIRTSS